MFAETGAPRPRPPWDEADGAGRPAAVLILVYPDDDGEARVVLTERADRGGHHSGEVSFPGGRAEADDADLVATALREANEEVGLDAATEGVRVLGTLAGPLDPRLELRGDAGHRRRRAAPDAGRAADGGGAILEPPVAAFLPGRASW